MVWPNPQGTPGARISAITPEGRTVVLLNEPGHFGLKKMIDSAKRKRKDGGVFELSWENSGVSVAANLKIVATPAPVAAPATASGAAGFRGLKLPEIVAQSVPAVNTPAPAGATAANAAVAP